MPRGKGGQSKKGKESYEAILVDALVLLQEGKFDQAQNIAHKLVTLDENKIVGYQIFIQASLGKEDFTAALMGCYEAMQKFPEDETMRELTMKSRMLQRDTTERPIRQNEALVGVLPSWEISLDGSICFLEPTQGSILCASDDGEIAVIRHSENNNANEKRISFQVSAWVNSCCLSPNGIQVAVGCNDGTFRILNFGSTITSQSISFGSRSDWVDHILWYKDSQEKSFIACSIQNTVGIFSKTDENVTLIRKLEAHLNSVQGIFFDQHKQRLTTVANKESFFWNHSEIVSSPEPILNAPQEILPFDGIVQSYDLNPNTSRQYLAAVGLRDGDCLLWDLSNTKLRRPMSLVRSDGAQKESITAVSFGEIKGKFYLASACAVGSVEVYSIMPNVTKSSSMTVLRAHRRAVSVISVHPVHRHILATGGYDGVIYVWDLSLKNPQLAVSRLIPHRNIVQAVTSTRTDQQVSEFMIRQLKWSDTGDQIFAGYCDGTVRCFPFKLHSVGK